MVEQAYNESPSHQSEFSGFGKYFKKYFHPKWNFVHGFFTILITQSTKLPRYRLFKEINRNPTIS